MSTNTKKPETDYSYKHLSDRPKSRTCLKCQAKFKSEGWGNRLCVSCRGQSTSHMAA